MKTKRTISLVLVLMLLASVFSILPIHAEGESSAAVEILRHNVVYGEKVQIAYALDCEVGADVTVKYTVDGNTYDATLYKEVYTDAEGNTYPIYVTHGFHATDFTDVVSATAYIGDEAPSDAEYDVYSVAEYFYAMLYKNGYIDKEIDESDVAATKPDSDRKNLYLSMLSYGKYAQEVLVNNKGGNETLITDYCYLYAAKGVSINGKESGLFVPGAEVTLSGGDAFVLTLNGGDTNNIGSSYTAQEGIVAEVSLAVAEDTVAVTDYESGVPYSDYVSSYDSDENKITGAYPATTTNLMMGLASSDNNSYLQVRNAANSNLTGTTKAEIANTLAQGNCYTFEAAIKINGATNGGRNFARLKFINTNGGEALNLILGTDSSKKLQIAVSGSPTGGVAASAVLFNVDDAVIATGSWFTVRVEFYFLGAGTASSENTYMKLYVGETLAYDGLASWAVGSNITRAQIDHISSSTTHNIFYDDIAFTRTDKTYAEGDTAN